MWIQSNGGMDYGCDARTVHHHCMIEMSVKQFIRWHCRRKVHQLIGEISPEGLMCQIYFCVIAKININFFNMGIEADHVQPRLSDIRRRHILIWKLPVSASFPVILVTLQEPQNWSAQRSQENRTAYQPFCAFRLVLWLYRHH